jgi:hypothetical protein
MAKTNEAASTETQAASTGSKIAPPAIDAASGGDSRSIVLDVPLQDGTKTKMKRTDYIRQRAKDGADRKTIRKEVEALQGKPVPYQVIFSATKDMPQFAKKDKTEAAPTGEGAAVSG